MTTTTTHNSVFGQDNRLDGEVVISGDAVGRDQYNVVVIASPERTAKPLMRSAMRELARRHVAAAESAARAEAPARRLQVKHLELLIQAALASGNPDASEAARLLADELGIAYDAT